MHSSETPSRVAKSSSILARARRLGSSALLAVVPLAAPVDAVASSMTLDYSFAGDYSNSGWFIGAPDDSKADGIILPGGFKLWGNATLTDSMFWRYDSYYQETVPRSDFTGVAFAWGGRITGGTTSEDKLSAPFEFSVDFTGPDSSYISVNTYLRLGYSTNPYEISPDSNTSIPSNNGGNYTSFSQSYNSAGLHEETGNLSINLMDTPDDLYWFAVLTVDWNNEFVSSRNWQGSYVTLNGDTMDITIPQNSIDVTYIPGTPPPTHGVPDSGSTLALFAVGLLALRGLHRRR